MSDVQHVRLGSKPDVCSTSAHGAQAAGALTGLPRELRDNIPNIWPVMQRRRAAAGEHGSPWNLTMPPDQKGYGDGSPAAAEINAEIRKWFQKIWRRHDFLLVYVFFKCAMA